MKKSFALVAAVSALVMAGAAYAQPAPSTGGGQRGHMDRAPMTRADLDSLTDARIAAIKAGLKLTPEQEKLWEPVEQALRSNAANRAERMEKHRESRTGDRQRPDFMERLERRSAWATAFASSATGLSTAMKPLWASLDERQQRLLPILMRPADGMRGQHRRGGRDGRGHHGMMQGKHKGMMEGSAGGMQQGAKPDEAKPGEAKPAPKAP